MVIYIWVRVGAWNGPEGGGRGEESGNDRKGINWVWLVGFLPYPVRTILMVR